MNDKIRILDKEGNPINEGFFANGITTARIANGYPTMPMSEISDGYHSFDELYSHRCALFLLACKYKVLTKTEGLPWMSICHSDGTSFEGWFIVGMTVPIAGHKEPENRKEQMITYHLPEAMWDLASKWCVIVDKAPEWDGHTSNDVLLRILESL